MKIEVGKFYKARDGKKVRIYALDGGGNLPIHGAYLTTDGRGWITCSWYIQGTYFLKDESQLDLVSEWEEQSERKSKAVPHGYWLLNFPVNKHIIEAKSISYDQVQNGDVDFNFVVHTWDTGYFAGNSIEDVRFITKEEGNIQFQPIKIISTRYLSPDKIFMLPGGIRYYSDEEVCFCGTMKIPPCSVCTGPEKTMLNELEEFEGVTMITKCECGSDSLGSPKHSDYCPKFKAE